VRRLSGFSMHRNTDSFMSRLAPIILAGALALPLHAQITYVDAVEGAAGNTFATGGSLSDTSWLATNNGANSIEDRWDRRSPFGNGGVVFQSSHFTTDAGGDQMPELTTQVTGLSDGFYDVWVFFWDNNGGPNNWTIAAGLQSGSLTTYSFDGIGIRNQTVLASSLDFVTDPMFTEATRTLYAVNIGQTRIVGGSNLNVHIDNLLGGGTNSRVWYDGIGYQPVPDEDNDGLPDFFELAHTDPPSTTALNPGDDLEYGGAGDGLDNLAEFLAGTDPNNPDSDGDGLEDGPEVNATLNDRSTPTGYAPTDPNNPNSDGDLYTDLEEVSPVAPLLAGDPNDPDNYPIHPGGLFIDFSSDGQSLNLTQKGPEHDLLYQPFLASHEIDSSNQSGSRLIVDRSETFSVPGFPGAPDVTLSVAFTDGAGSTGFPPTIKQMIGRVDNDAVSYQGNRLELMRDWLGVDPRAASGGNGDGSQFGPTYLRLTFSGLPAGTYQYRGYHHDTQSIGGDFELRITDSTRTAASLGNFRMTNSAGSSAANYQAVNPGTGNNPDVLSSTIELLFNSNGTDDVVLVYAVLEDPATFTRSFVGVNAIELTEATDSDGDFIPDSDDPNPGLDDNLIDDDGDNLSNTREWNLGTDSNNPDSDGDGLNDDVETNTSLFAGTGNTGTSPFLADSDGDGRSDGYEVANGFDPNSADVFYDPPAGSRIAAEDGVWTWFNDERAVWHLGKLYTGYVDSDGFPGITQYDPVAMTLKRTVLGTAAAQQVDDHNNPSVTVRPDGTLLAIYAKHSNEQFYYWRVSLVAEPEDLSDWGPENVSPAQGANVTYNNTFRLSGESDRIYNFSRIVNWDPTVSYSDDDGLSWTGPIHFIDAGGSSVRPYPQTVSNGTDRIDMIYTDGHPDSVNNSIYHLYYQSGGATPGDGSIRLSDGSVLDAGSDLKTFADIEAGDPIDHDGDQPDTAGIERGTVVYQYNASPYGGGGDLHDYLPGGRAWTWDIDYDSDGNPLCVFQVQLSNVTGTSGFLDDRIYYYYARWTGTEWQKRLIAQGGRPIYSSQRWYGGGITIDPDNPNVVYISSSSADPGDLTFNAGATGAAGDPYLTNTTLNPGDRYEILRGVTADGGLTFAWEPITANSEFDNLRPIVPANHGYDRHALWLYGQYTTFQNYSTAVVGLFENGAAPLRITGFGFVGGNPANDFFIDVEGGVAGRKVTSSDNLVAPFTDVPTTDDSANRFFISPANRNALRDFFRVEEQ
jgi:hypothetical protein